MRIVVTGGNGFLGRHFVELLEKHKAVYYAPSRANFDFLNLQDTLAATEGSNVIVHMAGNVGGIGYNQLNGAKLFADNFQMGFNILEAARINKIAKVVFIGTVCSYPENCPVPFEPRDLWNGYPEPTNAPYGIAKRALITLGYEYAKAYGFCFVPLIPTNMYGEGDHYDEGKSHVVPALIKKLVDARNAKLPEVEVWGSGRPTRELLYVKDACIAIAQATYNYPSYRSTNMRPDMPIMNIGSGVEISIKDLANLIQRLVGYEGRLIFNPKKPDGQKRRLISTEVMERELKFKPSTPIVIALERTIKDYEERYT